MKIRISYQLEEEKEAATSVAVLQQLLPRARVKKKENEGDSPYKHVYLSTPKPDKT